MLYRKKSFYWKWFQIFRVESLNLKAVEVLFMMITNIIMMIIMIINMIINMMMMIINTIMMIILIMMIIMILLMNDYINLNFPLPPFSLFSFFPSSLLSPITTYVLFLQSISWPIISSKNKIYFSNFQDSNWSILYFFIFKSFLGKSN